MKKVRSELNILLLQIRYDKETMLEEFYEFVQYSGLREEQFTVLYALQNHSFDPQIIEQYDALFIGGSSDVSVLSQSENLFTKSCNHMLMRCYDQNIPVLASCFGIQMATACFGGEICLSQHEELGIYPISLTQAAKNDPLMKDLPDPFWAVVGHRECGIILPKNAELLCFSKECPIHAFKFINKPFYCFQFHPEMNLTDLIARVIRYQERFQEDEEQINEMIKKSRHVTHQANKIVSHFVDRIIL